MPENPDTIPLVIPDPWDGGEAARAVADVAEIVRAATGIAADVASDGRSFTARAPSTHHRGAGLREVKASFVGTPPVEAALRLEVDLLIPSVPRLPLGELPAVARGLFSGRWRAADSGAAPPPGMAGLAIATEIAPRPLGVERRARLLAELRSVVDWTRRFDELLPDVAAADARSARLYAEIEHLDYIPGLPEAPLPGTELGLWAEQTFAFLASGLPVAITADSSVEADYALAVLAVAAARLGKTIGRVLPPVPARVIPEMARRAPGILAVPATRLAAGGNLYELGDDVRVMLDALRDAGSAAIFFGSQRELERVFHGGQGAAADPLRPVVRHLPAVPLVVLAELAVRAAAAGDGGLPRKREAALAAMVARVLERPGVAADEAPELVRPAAQALVSGACADELALGVFVDGARAVVATLGSPAVSACRPAARVAHVRSAFVAGLVGGGFRASLAESLFGQGRALDELAARLETEALTRHRHQPLRYLTQGTPGTGKSESVRLLAGSLDVPHVVIDCATFQDVHTASSQLLGSGRGIVGSHRAGRLEEAARAVRGAVVEVADLDHAPAHVRSHVGDLFLKALDVGSAESATGATFSCAGLIFAFTVNLPGGLDERLRRAGTGFGAGPSHQEVARDVRRELRSLLSGALLSRLGDPILFDPIDSGSLQGVAARVVREAAAQALDSLGMYGLSVAVDERVGAHVVAALPPDAWTTGARTIAEAARGMAARAVVSLLREPPRTQGRGHVVVGPGVPGALVAVMTDQETEGAP